MSHLALAGSRSAGALIVNARKEREIVQTSSNLIGRLGAIAAIVGGLLWSAKAFYDRNEAPPWPTDITDTLFFVVLLLFLAALTGLYARCRGRLREWEELSLMGFVAGSIGLVGSIAGLLTGMHEVGPSWWLGISWWMFVFGFFVMDLSLLLLGNSIIQSGALLPRWRGSLPVAIGSLGIVLILVGDAPNSSFSVYPTLALWMVYGLGWVGLGYVLYSDENETTHQPAPVR